ncbi:tRNA (guanosine(46)-N7)-methyltransferase TrmB [Enterococcus timonensis]|uniref:tRNA (guanosine(46)-N7)-methyltransferase TrmB n=1 Tax=Enterococcus timonensis TaxID=1852364 RepID=UPI0008DA58B6|nr:tRNA (guanosine(46)-N7)-methyltransferase TrmB [Enterococcus timonensis]
MRLRHKPWAQETFEQNENYATGQPENFRGKWQSRFEKNQPIHIEVGSGKGRFLYDMAAAHPEINYIAMEMQINALVTALDRLVENPLPNLQLLWADGSKLTNYFAENEVARIYLNFSDPWPKKKHEKRRLTYKTFLQQYQEIMEPDGAIHFKTDNQGLFEYSLMSLANFGMTFDFISLDLHQSEFVGNIMTEYEERFAQQGKRIYRLEAQFPLKK